MSVDFSNFLQSANNASRIMLGMDFFSDGEFINCYRQVIIPECGGTKLAVSMLS